MVFATFTIRRAFTLTEMLMVIVLLGITAVIVGPQMLEAGTFKAQAAGRAVISDILFAQNDAIARQTERRVVFDPTNDSYVVTDGGGAPVAAGWTGRGVHKTDFKTDSRFQGVQLQEADFGGSAVLVFDALGTPVSAGQVQVVSGHTRYCITVAAMTGRVTVALVEPGNPGAVR